METPSKLLLEIELNRLSAVFESFADIAPRDRSAHEAAKGLGRCAVCRKKPPEVRLSAAHITPREEGGEDTSTNLVCLCIREKRSLRKIRKSHEEVGCHDLLDRYQLWSRKDIVDLCNSVGQPHYELKANDLLESRTKSAGRLLGTWQYFANATNWALARRELNVKLKRAENNEQRIALLLEYIRVERKSHTKDRVVRLQQFCKALSEVLHSESPSSFRSERGTFQYELGMIYFQLRKFREAAEMFARSVNPDDPLTLINGAQCEVSRFEAVRRGYDRSTVEDMLSRLHGIVSTIDGTCRSGELARKQLSILLPWRIDGRLHAARMAASLMKASEARKLFDEAVYIRDKESQSLEAAVFTVLKFAEGEVLRAEGRYAEAQKALGRAGMKLVRMQFKEFEYLENILEALVAFPQSACAVVDRERGNLKVLLRRVYEHSKAFGGTWTLVGAAESSAEGHGGCGEGS